MDLYLHSTVDLITNSSTEFYCSATKSTPAAIMTIIDTILQLGNSQVKAKDLFYIEIIPWDRVHYSADKRQRIRREGNYEGNYCFPDLIRITAKKDIPQEIADKLEDLFNNLFDAGEYDQNLMCI